jgi:ribonuclease HII
MKHSYKKIQIKIGGRKRFAPEFRMVGIDEVGRGPLAGPVVVAALSIPFGFRLPKKELGELRDSKALTAKKRGEWFSFLRRNNQVMFALGRAYPKTIDKINISAAANRAAESAFIRLCKMHSRINNHSKIDKIFLDGGLYIKNREHSQSVGAKTVIKGDEKIRPVALASIVAKVSRDRQMVRLAKKHPEYGFESHKGYATRGHYERLKILGPSPAHRLTFLS